MTPNQAKKLCEQHVAQLREHFDSVRIFVTGQSEDGSGDSIAHTYAAGNYYAQKGQIEEWLSMQREREREYIRMKLKREEDGK